MSKLHLIGICLLLITGFYVQTHEISQSTLGKHIEKNLTQAPTTEKKHPANITKSLENKKKDTAAKTPKVKKPQEMLVDNPENESMEVVAQPASIPVLVNKHYKLPDNYNPKDLVITKIPFIRSATSERRKMRRPAAKAIARLFSAAKKQGVSLLGVSAYRSLASQKSLFNYYIKEDGYRKARNYSALPGTSEHETGLAIDVTEGNGKCAADDCFGGTKEAKWLQVHAADFGFIIRYPKGKEAVTGYKYEPWHLRYVGVTIAKIMMKNNITLEEYYDTVPVNGDKNLWTFAH